MAKQQHTAPAHPCRAVDRRSERVSAAELSAHQGARCTEVVSAHQGGLRGETRTRCRVAQHGGRFPAHQGTRRSFRSARVHGGRSVPRTRVVSAAEPEPDVASLNTSLNMKVVSTRRSFSRTKGTRRSFRAHRGTRRSFRAPELSPLQSPCLRGRTRRRVAQHARRRVAQHGSRSRAQGWTRWRTNRPCPSDLTPKSQVVHAGHIR